VPIDEIGANRGIVGGVIHAASSLRRSLAGSALGISSPGGAHKLLPRARGTVPPLPADQRLADDVGLNETSVKNGLHSEIIGLAQRSKG